MQPYPAEWWLVEKDSYIRDAAGKVWRIDAKRRAPELPLVDDVEQHQATIVDATGAWTTISLPASRVVEVMIPTMDEAVSLIRGRLGGEVHIVKLDPIPPPWAKNSVSTRSNLAAHLLMFHGVGVSPTADKANGPLERLLELHTLAHARPHHYRILHVHRDPGGVT